MDVPDSFWVRGKTVISEIISASPKMFTSKSLKRVKCEWHWEVKVVDGINFTNQQILGSKIILDYLINNAITFVLKYGEARVQNTMIENEKDSTVHCWL